MYQIIELSGPYEPWWFFDDWQDYIVSVKEVTDFKQAQQVYQKKFHQMALQYDDLKEKANYQVAFWNEEDFYYCEDCDDDLINYHSLLITKNRQALLN